MVTLLLLLTACGGPNAGSPQTPEPPPVEAPTPPPQPEPSTVELTFGKQCQDPADGEPADLAAVKDRLVAAGIEVLTFEERAVCEACGVCPRLAVAVTTPATADEVQAVFAAAPPVDGPVVLDVGRKCEKPIEGAPKTVAELLAAIQAAGVEVTAHEARMACQACGCPELSVGVTVDPASAAAVRALAAGWTPAPTKVPASSLPPTEDQPKSKLP
jgi:hypothetical protein